MTHLETIPEVPWIRTLPLRTPTLPPATHTNAYIVGTGELAVVDPGSPWSEEREALDAWLAERAAAGERVTEVILTHHHVDHVSGAAHLAARLGVPVAAHARTAELLAGRIAVGRVVGDGDTLTYGDAELKAVFTPGHAPGHLCFFDARSGALVAGDMVASVGTIIIDPPEGDMRLYLDSLERLRNLGARRLLPAHGAPIDDPEKLLRHYIAHRLDREGKVVSALARAGGVATVEELIPGAYPEISTFIYPLAARSLLAHLLKLRDDGQVTGEEGGRWRMM